MFVFLSLICGWQRNILSWFPGIKLGVVLMGEAESWRAEPIGEKCSGGFPRPGRIHFTMGDLADEAKQSATKPELMEDVLSLVALAADKNCTAAVSKPQLEAFRDQAKDPAIAAGAQRIINDFDKIATMSKQDWSEIKDPDARALVEKYLKDNAPDSVISPNDVA